MNRLAAILLFTGAAALHGQDGQDAQDTPAPGPTAPQLTTSAGWTFGTTDNTRDATWKTSESAFVGLSARWGSSLTLATTLKSDFSGAPLNADDALDELALTWTANSFSILTVGKQRLSWGTARVFSAIDSLEPPLDPSDPKAKPRGVTGIKAELIPLDWASLWLLALPASRLDDTVLAARFDVLLEEADLSLGAVRSVSRPLTGYTSSGPVRDRRESPAFFANFAQFFDRFGLYGEAQLRQGRDRDWFLSDGSPTGTTLAALDASAPWTLRATGGLQVEVPVWLNGTLRWLTEYHYNGEGFTDGEASDFAAAWPRALVAAPGHFIAPSGLFPGAYRQHYLYTGLSGIPLAEKLTASSSVLAGVGGLVLVSSSLYWEVGQALGVNLGYDHFDCWSGTPDQSELLFLGYRNRVNVSVTAWY